MARQAIFGGSVDAEGAIKALQQLFRAGYASGLAVTQRGAGANMSVDISAGGGMAVTAASIGYYGWSTAVENVAVDAADPSNPRKDIVVQYIDLSLITTANTNNTNACKFLVVPGTPAASPSDPSDSAIQTAVGAGNPWNKLARVDVGAGATSVVDGNITDLRTPMALGLPYIYGGANNTLGHLVPNVADGTVLVTTDTNKVNTGLIIDGAVTVAKRSGGFYASTFTNNATGNRAITGVGFTPKLVLLFYRPATSTSNSSGGYGFMTDSAQFATAWASNTGSDAVRYGATDKCIAVLGATSSTPTNLASFVSMDSDGFTINVTAQDGQTIGFICLA